ncbi:hypothetical protein [Lacticaseibacillus manihotivorans]|uniref:Uncharacterized protein n=1 Tax=Lacticaseibacillus manihotivorans TaxID=88233 RepID=A0A5P8JPB3_9LACO|nr:hypothetical protein [Lacticaseibacillus manihotivorans]QFQ90953.1 hypothetical protein LM010_05725 [Lacticaseibacillus manihotivorans]
MDFLLRSHATFSDAQISILEDAAIKYTNRNAIVDCWPSPADSLTLFHAQLLVAFREFKTALAFCEQHFNNLDIQDLCLTILQRTHDLEAIKSLAPKANTEQWRLFKENNGDV